MAKQLGDAGIVEFGATAVAQITGWSLSVEPIVAEGRSVGDLAMDREYIAQDWTATIEGWFQDSDTGGQDELITALVGTKIADLELHTSSANQWTSTSALLTSYESESSGDGGYITFSATLSCAGAVIAFGVIP